MTQEELQRRTAQEWKGCEVKILEGGPFQGPVDHTAKWWIHELHDGVFTLYRDVEDGMQFIKVPYEWVSLCKQGIDY